MSKSALLTRLVTDQRGLVDNNFLNNLVYRKLLYPEN